MIPQVIATPAPELFDPRANCPLDHEFDGTFIHKETGEPYALAIHPEDVYFRTHSLKNSARFWQGTEAEFEIAFRPA